MDELLFVDGDVAGIDEAATGLSAPGAGGGVPDDEPGEKPFLIGPAAAAAAAVAAPAAATAANGLGTTGATATGNGAPGAAARITGTGSGTAAGETKPAKLAAACGAKGPPGSPPAGSP